MAIEDTFKGAKNAMILNFAYFNTVAEEIGMERAAACNTRMCESMGAKMGKMMKDQAGVEELDAKAAVALAANAIEDGYGIKSEVIEESPQRFVSKMGKCPDYEAAQEMGIDTETIEALCRSGSLRLMDTMVKQLNPNLSCQLRKFRSAADDFCEEEIVLG